MRLFFVASSALWLATAPAAFAGQAYDEARAAIGDALARTEINLADQEALSMNIKDWNSKMDAAAALRADYNQRTQQESAYCTGTFEEAEYNRRVAECNSFDSQMQTLQNQLDLEFSNLDQQRAVLQSRHDTLNQQYEALKEELVSDVGTLVNACVSEQIQACSLPPAPGPRTAELVANMNKSLAGG